MGKRSRIKMEIKENTGNTLQRSDNIKRCKKANIFEKAAHCFLKYLEILGQMEPELWRFISAFYNKYLVETVTKFNVYL